MSMIALIDCNNFYCSCERVFQPSLRQRPLIVLSNNDGCAISRSEEAKSLGIQMAQPAFMVEDLIRKHQVQVHSSNYTLYGDMSSRIMQVVKEFVPRTEVYSIDEIFADLVGLTYADLFQLGKQIRDRIGLCTGIPVSVGIGQTKALAKMANRYAKKTRPEEAVFVADCPERTDTMLHLSDVGDIWGIGKQYAALLKRHGFHSAKDFVDRAPEKWIRQNLSVVGQRLWWELKGISCFEWKEQTPARKNICTSRSFGNLIKAKRELRQAVAKFTASCGEKLRREKTCAQKLEVFIQTNPHRPQDQQYFQSVEMTLSMPTNLTPELMKYSMRGLNMIFREGFLYQKAGVVVSELVPAREVQLALFDGQSRPEDQKLMESVDAVNHSLGNDLVRFGVHDYGENWKLKQGHLSPHYTTRLDHLPQAR